MKITLGQIRIYTNQPQKNFEQIAAVITRNTDSDMIVFPQLALSGMYCGDQLLKPAYQNELLRFNDKIRELSADVLVVFGNVFRNDKGLFNASYVAYRKQWLCNPIIKQNLSAYEHHYFLSEESDDGFEFMDEDIRVSFDNTDSDIFTIILGSKPFAKESPAMMHKGVYVNPVGIQNNGSEVFVFDGGSYVSDGHVKMSALDDFKPSEKSYHYELLIPNDVRIEHKVYNALVSTLKYFDEEALSYGPKWIIGVSGGLDSSVSVALLVDAFGKERVLGVNMPSEFTRDITKNNAHHLSEHLGFPMITIPIGAMAQSTVDSFALAGYETLKGLSYENVQARLRGHTLMTLSSLENGVVINNGNKIEVAFGYATLYGDAIGALAILGDLTKLEVGELANSFNTIHGKEIIPNNLIPSVSDNKIEWDFAPSAELAQDQFDPMKWAYHDHLVEYLLQNSVESYMEMYLNGTVLDTLPGKYLESYQLLDPQRFIEDLEWVLRQMNLAVYKRVQAPPIARVSAQFFGNETQATRMESQAYRDLKEAILNLKRD